MNEKGIFKAQTQLQQTAFSEALQGDFTSQHKVRWLLPVSQQCQDGTNTGISTSVPEVQGRRSSLPSWRGLYGEVLQQGTQLVQEVQACLGRVLQQISQDPQ